MRLFLLILAIGSLLAWAAFILASLIRSDGWLALQLAVCLGILAAIAAKVWQEGRQDWPPVKQDISEDEFHAL